MESTAFVTSSSWKGSPRFNWDALPVSSPRLGGIVTLPSTDTPPTNQVFLVTNRTITRLEDLDRELAVVRRTGIAAEIEEFQPGLACLATPVKDAEGRTTAAVALSVPVKEFAKRRRQLETLIRHGGEELSRLLS